MFSAFSVHETPEKILTAKHRIMKQLYDREGSEFPSPVA